MKKKRMGCEVLFIASRLQATWHAPIGRNTIITAVIISTLKSSDGTVPKNGSYKKHFKFPHEMLHNLIVEPGQQKAPRVPHHLPGSTLTEGRAQRASTQSCEHPDLPGYEGQNIKPLSLPGPTRARKQKKTQEGKHKNLTPTRIYQGKGTWTEPPPLPKSTRARRQKKTYPDLSV